MGTTAEKLEYLSNTKELIRQAIIDKGVPVETSDTFRSYPEKISQIETGGGSSGWIELFDFVNIKTFEVPFETLDDIFIVINEIEEVRNA